MDYKQNKMIWTILIWAGIVIGGVFLLFVLFVTIAFFAPKHRKYFPLTKEAYNSTTKCSFCNAQIKGSDINTKEMKYIELTWPSSDMFMNHHMSFYFCPHCNKRLLVNANDDPNVTAGHLVFNKADFPKINKKKRKGPFKKGDVIKIIKAKSKQKDEIGLLGVVFKVTKEKLWLDLPKKDSIFYEQRHPYDIVTPWGATDKYKHCAIILIGVFLRPKKFIKRANNFEIKKFILKNKKDLIYHWDLK